MTTQSDIMTRAQFWERHDALKATHPDNAAFAAAARELHEEYWGAYVRAFNVKPPSHLVAKCREALAAGDKHMNSPYTQIVQWDSCMPTTARIPGLVKALRDNGQGWSMFANTCLLKEAMRQHIEANPETA